MGIWDKLAGKGKRYLKMVSRQRPKTAGSALPRNLRFPQPPFRIDHSLIKNPIEAELTEYLEQVAAWRRFVLAFLQTSDSENLSGFSLRARSKLIEFLRPEWSAEMQGHVTRSPYNICAFPLDALSVPRNTLESVLDVLRWRAGLVDYLADVWDVIGEPELDMDECSGLAEFLTPVTESVCSYCLTYFDPELTMDDTPNNPYQHECLLVGHAHAKWPSDLSK